MDCCEIRELIVADFSDGEAGALTSREVHAHLLACPACATFSEEVREHVLEPFREISDISPPDDVWLGIKAELLSSGAVREDLSPLPVSEVSRVRERPGFFSRLLSGFIIPRPALAAVAVAAILTGVYVFSPMENGGAASYAFLADDVEFLSSLGSDDETANGVEFVKLGTSIEEYFL